MWCKTVFGEHIAAAAALGGDQLHARFIPDDITAIGFNLADLRTTCGVLAPWLLMRHKTTAGRRLACGIRCAETARCGDTGRVPGHAAAKRIAVADTVAASR